MPREGYKTLTISEALYSKIKKLAEDKGLSMSKLLNEAFSGYREAKP